MGCCASKPPTPRPKQQPEHNGVAAKRAASHTSGSQAGANYRDGAAKVRALNPTGASSSSSPQDDAKPVSAAVVSQPASTGFSNGGAHEPQSESPPGSPTRDAPSRGHSRTPSRTYHDSPPGAGNAASGGAGGAGSRGFSASGGGLGGASGPEEGEEWDKQNAQDLDPQAFLRHLAEQQAVAPGAGQAHDAGADEEAAAEAAPPPELGEDDEEYHRTVQQVREDHADQAAPQAHPGVQSVMQRAANSERAKSIIPAMSGQNEAFRLTSTLCVAVYKGCVFFNQYLVVKFLGKGACGKVYLVMDTLTTTLYALKITQKNDIPKKGKDGRPGKNPLEDLRAEVAIMGRVAHPNMVCLKEVVDDPQRNKVLIVMNYAEGGPILPRKAIAQGLLLPEDMCRHYFRDILRSLEYLHSQKIIHGDLKPENILLTSTGVVKLSDFGCSRVFVTGNEYFDRFRGTPAFLAPEIMQRQTHYRGRPVDVYAMGVCLYALVFGSIPFSATNLYNLFQKVQEEPVRFPATPVVTPTLIDLLERMLTKDPKARITIPELREHAWVTCEGQYPMHPFKELFRDGLLHFDPDPPITNYLKQMLQLKHRYVTFATGTMVIQQSEVGYYLALIVEGQADVCVRPRLGGDHVDSPEDAHALQQDPALLRKLQARAAAAKREVDAKARPDGLFCIAQRKTGDVLGEMAFVRESRARKATVIATTPLKVALYTYADIEAYGAQHPGALHQLKQLCWQRDAELMHFAAMYRLAEASAYFSQLSVPEEEGALAPQP